MPRRLVPPLRARYVLFDAFSHPASLVCLTAAGVLGVQTSEARADAAAFWRLVQLGLRALTAQRPDPENPDRQPTVSRRDALTDTAADAGLPVDVALRAFLVFVAEGISGGSTGPDSEGDWTFFVGRDFRRWRDAADLCGFIEARSAERLSAMTGAPWRISGELEAPTMPTNTAASDAPLAPTTYPGAKPSAPGPAVFLCHSSNDKLAVRRLERRLRGDGYATWLDERDLLPGQEWDLEIRRAVRAADVVVVCLSKGSVTKAGYVQKEIRVVLDAADEQPEGAMFLIPARLEECEVPDRLSRWHWVDLYRRGGYHRLKLTLENLKAAKREP